MKARGILIAVVLVVIQVVAIVVWRLVEGTRTRDAPFVAEPISGRAPAIQFEFADGTTSSLEDFRGCPVLIHFWASWCSPCRDELPAVLSLEIDGLTVLAAAIDDTWPAMRQLTDTRNRHVVRVPERSSAKAFRVGELPVTFLIDSDGTLVERYQGARAWNDASARTHLARILGDASGCAHAVAPPAWRTGP